MEKIIVSACLLGIYCRYDGNEKANKNILKLLENFDLIPMCPEILGGLPTPRPPSEIVGNKVINIEGKDVTKEFIKGGEESLKIAKLFGIKKAILKSKSPSCGYKEIYDGSFSKNIIEGNGITTKLFLENGIEVFTEEDFENLFK